MVASASVGMWVALQEIQVVASWRHYLGMCVMQAERLLVGNAQAHVQLALQEGLQLPGRISLGCPS